MAIHEIDANSVDTDKLEKMRSPASINLPKIQPEEPEDRPLLGLIGDTVNKNLNAARLGAAEGAGNLYGVDYGDKLTGAIPAILPNILNRGNDDLSNPTNQIKASENLLELSKALAEKQKAAGKPITALKEEDLQKMGLLTPNTDYFQNLIDTARGGIKENKEESAKAYKEAPLPFIAANLAAGIPAYGVANNALEAGADATGLGSTKGITTFSPLAENELVQKLPERAQKILASPLVNNGFQAAKMGAIAGVDKNINGEGSGNIPEDIKDSALKYGGLAEGATLAQMGLGKLVGNNYKFPAETGNLYNEQNVINNAKNVAGETVDNVIDKMANSKALAADSLNKATTSGATVDLSSKIKDIGNLIGSKGQWLPGSEDEAGKIQQFMTNFEKENPDLTKVPINQAQAFLKQMNQLGPFGQMVKNADYKTGIGNQAKSISDQIKNTVDNFGPYSAEKEAQSDTFNTMKSLGADLKDKSLSPMDIERQKQLTNQLSNKIMSGNIDSVDLQDRAPGTLGIDENANSIINASNYAKGLPNSNPTNVINGIPGIPSIAKKAITALPNLAAGAVGKATNFLENPGDTIAALGDKSINGSDQVLQSVAGNSALNSLPQKYGTVPIQSYPSIQPNTAQEENPIQTIAQKTNNQTNGNIQQQLPKNGPPLQNTVSGISPEVSKYVERNAAQTNMSHDFDKLNNSSPEELTDLATKIKNSPVLAGQSENGSALRELAIPLLRAASAPEQTRSALLWSMYSQPAFQMFLKQNSQDKTVPSAYDTPAPPKYSPSAAKQNSGNSSPF